MWLQSVRQVGAGFQVGERRCRRLYRALSVQDSFLSSKLRQEREEKMKRMKEKAAAVPVEARLRCSTYSTVLSMLWHLVWKNLEILHPSGDESVA